MSKPKPRGPLFILGLLLGFIGGLLVAGNELLPATEDPLSLSDEAIEVIEQNYFRDPDGRQLGDAGVSGMVDDLRKRFDDRFSHYFDPKTLEDFNAQTSGQFTGVGLAVSEVKDGLRIAQVYPDTPAQEAGLVEGDVITEADGESLTDLSAAAAAAKIKGPAGSEVELTVRSEGREPRQVVVQRADVRIPAVRGEIKRVGGRPIAYVQLATFSEGAHAELREEVEKLYRRGAEGLVLDLRGNGGGLLNEAVLTSSVFVEEGVIVATEGRTQPRTEYDAVGDAIETQRPAAVLVNGDTASAAEILAAAMSDYGLAEIVGERTFGKGTFQEVIELENGGALDLTVGEYLTSEDVSLAGKGIKPDVKVPDDPDQPGDEALREALDNVAGQI